MTRQIENDTQEFPSTWNQRVSRHWENPTPAKLRGFLCFEHLKVEFSEELSEIDAFGVAEGNRRSGQCYKWDERVAVLGPRSMLRFKSVAPRTISLFNDAPWDLLGLKRIPTPKVEKLLERFHMSRFFSGCETGDLPRSQERLTHRPDYYSQTWSKPTQRIAIYHFFRLLAKVRARENDCGKYLIRVPSKKNQQAFDFDIMTHGYLLSFAFMISRQPLLQRVKWLYRDFSYIGRLLDKLRWNVPEAERRLHIDWPEIERQFGNRNALDILLRIHANETDYRESDLVSPVSLAFEVPIEAACPWPRHKPE